MTESVMESKIDLYRKLTSSTNKTRDSLEEAVRKDLKSAEDRVIDLIRILKYIDRASPEEVLSTRRY